MANTPANVLVGVCAITLGTTGGAGGTATGYTNEDGAELTFTSEAEEIMVDQSVWALKEAIKKCGCEVKFTFSEPSLANIVFAHPCASLGGATVSINEPGDTLTPIELTMIGKNPAGFARTIILAAVVPTGGFSYAYGKAKAQSLSVTFKCLKDASDTVPVTITDAAA
jgi:hypothetical protein